MIVKFALIIYQTIQSKFTKYARSWIFSIDFLQLIGLLIWIVIKITRAQLLILLFEEYYVEKISCLKFLS